jgi:hypothetical protein
MGPIAKATQARFYPFGVPSGNDRYLRILLRTPAIADPSNDRRGPSGEREVGSFEMGAAGPLLGLSAVPRPPQSHETVSVSTTDHRDWNSFTNPHHGNGDDLTVSVRHIHAPFDAVPTTPRSAMLGVRVPRSRATAR